MASLRRFLIVDDDSKERFFVSKTLLRHFPEAAVQECSDLTTAVSLMKALPAKEPRTVVIAHRTPQADGRSLVAALRAAHATVPIVWLSGGAKSDKSSAPGATRILDKKAWLMIGQVVRDLA